MPRAESRHMGPRAEGQEKQIPQYLFHFRIRRRLILFNGVLFTQETPN